MPERPSDLPDFENPPLVEVALAVQFAPVTGLRAPVLARWKQAHFPDARWEERPLMPLPQELRGVPNQQIYFDLRDPESVPRCRHWFIDDRVGGLLQIQDDCVVHNWRKANGAPAYPRYERIREEFRRELEALEVFIAAEHLGELRPRQCEVTYVNQMDLEGRDVGDVMVGWSGAMSDSLSPEVEGVEITSHHRMLRDSRPIGRLHIRAAAARTQGPRVLRLTLTARGAPPQATVEGAMTWLDLGRDAVVRGFCSVTEESVHYADWKRRS